jgi:hypothetical protein
VRDILREADCARVEGSPGNRVFEIDELDEACAAIKSRSGGTRPRPK